MRISWNWLGQYVPLDDLTPEDVAARLTQAGLEVEALLRQGGTFEGVQLGCVMSVAPHPNADRLRLVTVDVGADDGAPLQVVCGAPNVRPDLWIAFAPLGAQVFSPKQGDMFVLRPTKIRGVVSEGMVCSLEELGLGEMFTNTEDGIWPIDAALLAPGACAGQPLREALALTPDTILVATPTVNRGDLMALTEVAREVAALFQREWRPPMPPHLHVAPGAPAYSVRLPEPDLCPSYGALLLNNIQPGPTPAWMVRCLQAAGMRSINVVVDITNFVMLELGQPLHAFDRNALGFAGELSVRRAMPGETLTTLDGLARALTPETVVVTMNNKPVALAGVFGGLETQVTENTTSIVLESAWFSPVATRRSARSLALRTEASARFERGVDPDNWRRALARAAQLFQQHTGAQVVSLAEATLVKQRAAASSPASETRIALRYSRLREVLGASLSKEAVNQALKRLGFMLHAGPPDADTVLVVPPSHRLQDVQREIDLIEEIYRTIGQCDVLPTLPTRTLAGHLSPTKRRHRLLHTALQAVGLQEVNTPSLVGLGLSERTGFAPPQQPVQALRSHSAEFTLLRQTLLPNLVEVAQWHLAQGIQRVWIYESGKRYVRQAKASPDALDAKDNGVAEAPVLAVLLMGDAAAHQWPGAPTTDFYTLKGMAGHMAAAWNLSLRFLAPKEAPPPDGQWLLDTYGAQAFHPGQTALVYQLHGAQGPLTRLGVLAQWHPAQAALLKCPADLPVFLMEWQLPEGLRFTCDASSEPAVEVFQAVRHPSAFPTVARDFAFCLAEAVSHQEVLDAIQAWQLAHADLGLLLRDVALFDLYRGPHVPEGQRSLAYRFTLQSDTETLTDSVVEAVMASLRQWLCDKLAVSFRA
jgi:phenylalanyl-tRNA synthetase beta chain